MLVEKEIRNHALICINELRRKAQKNSQIHIFLEKSLTDEESIEIVEEAYNYRVNGIATGTFWFKLLTLKAVVDTIAMTRYLRENLISFDSYIESENSNIELFNFNFKENRQSFKARGERTEDLMINLFKGCIATSDKDFFSCTKTKKDEHDEGKKI